MTEMINCGNCSFLLYYGEAFKDRFFIRGTSEVTFLADAYGDTCPSCGVSFTPASVRTTIED